MEQAAQPVVVAFDGSGAARSALTAAATLFPGRPLLIVTVWEAGLAYAMQPSTTAGLSGFSMPSLEQADTIDRAQHEHASQAAAEGARLASELGATGEPLPVADSSDVVGTLLEIADDRDAAALVVGSRGLGAIRARLEGSTSKRLLHEARRPVLVIHEEHS